MSKKVISRDVAERLGRLNLPFDTYGMDPFGISKKHLGIFFSLLEVFYKHYFRVRCFGIENVPHTGRAMVVSNHSGGVPTDGGMLLASLFFEANPPRLAHGMVEKFAQTWPFVSHWFSRVGQLPGLPEHAIRLLRDDRILMVFPEGARGTGKLYKDRYQLVRFGTGFMRIALQTKSPIIPTAFIGGEEALPSIYHANTLAKLVGAPYWPVPPYLLPVPLPLPCEIHYGEPLVFEGTGNEADHVIEGYVEQVKHAIKRQIKYGCALHGQRRAGLAYDHLGERP
ncbi:MAG TPA: acyltransferase family protein [Nannocystis exedens]|nr:acyltransferase family protein [Nannocystis exedens]